MKTQITAEGWKASITRMNATLAHMNDGELVTVIAATEPVTFRIPAAPAGLKIAATRCCDRTYPHAAIDCAREGR